ncbi:CBS domain-containing protein [Geodermatophilus obscurus]|uniref:CBS domain-containing protein n=2 Tax=Geodermatophilus obscurus TaxID=1861 RepID=A0A1M7SQH1_9ACTN|nr:CBS domain-containing protein [Geodermatophilus obscurus]
MSSLVHRGRAAITRGEPEGPEETEAEAVHGTLIPAGTSRRRARTAADVMTRFPATVHQSASMWTAWDRLQGTRTQHLVVVDDRQRPIGVLDDRTIALEWPPGPMGARRAPVHTLLRDRLRPRVRGADDVAAVARTMLGARADAVPVVDRDGRLFGLVTLWHFADLAAGGGRQGPPGGSAARPTGEG